MANWIEQYHDLGDSWVLDKMYVDGQLPAGSSRGFRIKPAFPKHGDIVFNIANDTFECFDGNSNQWYVVGV